MNLNVPTLFSFLMATIFFSNSMYGQAKREDFRFEYDDIAYSGFVERPEQTPKGLIVLIPGHGSTDFVSGGEYGELIGLLSRNGFAVGVWDKAGCGQSEGTYDHNQSLESSAEEALAAIAKLREMNVPGSHQIGLWGISRAGWVCPLVIEKDPAIAFWISVSGTDQFENSRYMLEANLRAEKRSESEIDVLMKEWDHYQRNLVRGGMELEEYLDSMPNLMKDPYFNPNNFQFTEEILLAIQNEYQSNEHRYDDSTNLRIMLDNFEDVLGKANIPVLAIFGEKDSQVDWRKTQALYRQTIGANPKAVLTVKTFPNGNHSIQKCKSGAMDEELEKFNGAVCDGYYEAMLTWLRELPLNK